MEDDRASYFIGGNDPRRTKMPARNFGTSAMFGIALMLEIAGATPGRADCIPGNLATPAPKDPVARVLAAQRTCPKNAIEFVEALEQLGARMEPTVVNFVGFHNPDPGAFFIFEIVSSTAASPSTFKIERGDLLFGHFTTTSNGQLVSNQEDLTIELIAWDPDKQFFNFYELVSGSWFYRGDSRNILDDVQLLHRQRNASEKAFGRGLRCSGCHVNGGLLQKELAPPHNDWSLQSRPLPMGALRPDAFVGGRLANAVDAGELSKLVNAAAQRLAASPGYRKVLAARSMQELLRPLFCPMEVNIESDSEAFDDRKPMLQIPSGFFVDSRLAAGTISIKRGHYDAALQRVRSQLPENDGRVDADHAWLTPVKAQSDIVAVESLVEQGVVDNEFVAAVLAVDFTNPVFSKRRCDLLKLVPEERGPDFVARLQSALRGASAPGAVELLDNLSDPARNADFHKKQALAFLANCQQRSADSDTVLDWLRLLAQRRAEVSTSEISRNPRGHILEDPNRVVFPTTQPPPVSAALALTSACQVR
jgi:hypothetical protein